MISSTSVTGKGADSRPEALPGQAGREAAKQRRDMAELGLSDEHIDELTRAGAGKLLDRADHGSLRVNLRLEGSHGKAVR